MFSVSPVVNSKIPPVFDPVGAFLVGRAELAGVWGVEFFGDEALEDFGVPLFVDVRKGEPHILGIHRRDQVDSGIELFATERVFIQEQQGFFRRWRVVGEWLSQCAVELLVHFVLAFGVRRIIGGDVVEQNETAFAEGVAALKGLAVEPFHFGWQVGGADRFQHSGKLILD